MTPTMTSVPLSMVCVFSVYPPPLSSVARELCLIRNAAFVRKDVEIMSERIAMMTTNITVRLGAVVAGLIGLLFASANLRADCHGKAAGMAAVVLSKAPRVEPGVYAANSRAGADRTFGR